MPTNKYKYSRIDEQGRKIYLSPRRLSSELNREMTNRANRKFLNTDGGDIRKWAGFGLYSKCAHVVAKRWGISYETFHKEFPQARYKLRTAYCHIIGRHCFTLMKLINESENLHQVRVHLGLEEEYRHGRYKRRRIIIRTDEEQD